MADARDPRTPEEERRGLAEPLLYDVQRDLPFYRTVVAFRNAIERLQVLRGTVVNPDEVHWWWGFGYLGRAGTGGDGPGGQRQWDSGAGGPWDDPNPWDEGDDPADSRVPRRPYGGAGAAGAEAEPIPDAGLPDAVGELQANS